MSVTGEEDDPIPHGLKGYRPPWKCKCDVCKAANAAYQSDYQASRKNATVDDEVAAKRAAKKKIPPISTQGQRDAAKARSESRDSVSRKKIGDMEKAVIEECATLVEDKRKPTLVVAARSLAKSLDVLAADPKTIAVQNQTMKQFIAVMSDLRGDKTTGPGAKRKAGSRLSTVGALTKVNRGR